LRLKATETKKKTVKRATKTLIGEGEQAEVAFVGQKLGGPYIRLK